MTQPQPAQQPRTPRLTSDGRLTSGRLSGLTMNRAIWVLCWPVLLESYLNWLVGVVDTKLAAGLSVSAADAVGPAAYFMWFIGLIGQALGVGATAVVSRSIGKGRLAVAGAAVGQTFILASIAGVLAGGLIGNLAEPIGKLVGLTDDALDQFTIYMTIIAMGVPATALLFAGIACLRGAGDSMGPLRAMVVVNIINIALSWLLSGIPLGIPGDHPPIVSPLGTNLGIAGIAIGTVASHVIGAALIRRALSNGKAGIRLRPSRYKPHPVTIRRILRVGLPNFFESVGLWLGNFIIVLFVGFIALSTGIDGTFGAHIIAIRIESVSFLPGFAVGTAVAGLVGQYLGAGSPKMARAALARSLLIASIIMGLMGLVFIVFPGAITRLFSPQEIHQQLVPDLLIICGVVQIPFAVALTIRSALRGAGDTTAVMALTWTTTYLVRLPLAYLLSGVEIPLPESLGGGTIPNPAPWGPSLKGLWFGLCAELAVRGVVFYLRFKSGKWVSKKV